MRRAVALLVALAALLAPMSAIAQARPRPTPLTPVQVARALIRGHRDALGTRVKGTRLSVAWAQVAVETGRGAKARGFNLGNVGGGRATFASAREGAAAYWRAVAKCKSAFAYFDAGDARGAALQLARCGYYTADPSVYADGMSKLREEFNRTVWVKVRSQLGV